MYEKIISKVERLKKECSFYETTAQAYVDFDGRCGYCGQDLVEDRFHYACGTIDHLIPQALYPEGKWQRENLILCCSLCNSLKRAYDPCQDLRPEELKPKNIQRSELLMEEREALLQLAKEYIAKKADPTHGNWWRARMILRGEHSKP